MSSKIEQIIEEIEEYINSCKYQPLSNTKIVVNKEEIDELLTELRLKTPDEIKRYQKIINNKEAILADAQAKADAIIAQATVHTNELINEHEIMQQAYAQANEIVQIATNQAQEILDKATIDANNIRYGAIQYTDDMLANLQGIISHTINTSTAKYDNLMKSLQDCYDIVNANRVELAPSEEEEEQEVEEEVMEQE
ncbi:ATPase [Candidatus Galacturonibacter soehngenii]|uniref:ATPase n=1 Tax=Candidatus Galacturonatibacter soehngenii TaxID=2307010 RepID=A0A7V7UH18_9FIRM|nr:ATPase [Candidatus Galacturonibacter soehngenii]KAB1439543.1 ATPase [Candidatus Galacturonibacter soehngenii]MBA4687059.1 ATPase [Candidatus Galacturonibacter soehngenii]